MSDTACLLPMARASLPWADIGPIPEMHVHIVSDLVTHVIGPVEDGHGHFQRRFVFTVNDKSVTASAMTTRLFTQLLTHARLQRAPFEPLCCVEKWHKALGAPFFFFCEKHCLF